MKPSDTGRPERPEPPFDLTHKMQRLALDLAWRAYGHDDEYRERLTTWLREHGLEVWRLLEAERDTAAPASPAVLEGESMRCAHCDGPRPVYCRECYQTFYAFYAKHRRLSARQSPVPERAVLVELANETAAWLDRIRDSFRLSGHDSDGDSLYSQEAMGAEHYAARLREAAALLKGEHGDDRAGHSKSITPHAVAHLALTRKTDTP